ncbi:MAG: NYN domain-containing protein [Gammaproteobacteria bacterium]|nr:NYN domain-containing protein [Gammaproteobacteria bacterium]MCI0591669.1 NYN domain-containing protein [Gammaproteobacteria bacterium]
MPLKPAYRTIVYIDGFNFYYGEVRSTPWKWLDPLALFEKILGPQNKLIKVRYFTARVQPSPNDPNVNIRQETYLRALQAHCPLVELHFGHFLRHKISMEHANPPPPTVDVWKNEEKGSDVNLALHLLNDAWLDAYDCAVIVSNDSDLAESLRLVKKQHKKLIGLITPGAKKMRKTSRQLRQYADFVKPIRTWALKSSQLPNPIPGTTIHKPASW